MTCAGRWTQRPAIGESFPDVGGAWWCKRLIGNRLVHTDTCSTAGAFPAASTADPVRCARRIEEFPD